MEPNAVDQSAAPNLDNTFKFGKNIDGAGAYYSSPVCLDLTVERQAAGLRRIVQRTDQRCVEGHGVGVV